MKCTEMAQSCQMIFLEIARFHFLFWEGFPGFWEILVAHPGCGWMWIVTGTLIPTGSHPCSWKDIVGIEAAEWGIWLKKKLFFCRVWNVTSHLQQTQGGIRKPSPSCEASLAKEKETSWSSRCAHTWSLGLGFSSESFSKFSSLATGGSFPGLVHDLLLLWEKKPQGITLVDLDENWKCGSRLVRPHFQSGGWGLIPFLGWSHRGCV